MKDTLKWSFMEQLNFNFKSYTYFKKSLINRVFNEV